jgi:hypothetical protein
MSTMPGSYATAELKASDADRDAVLAVLSEHFQAGRLTSAELEDRTGRALAARTYGDLAALTADLPGPVPAPGPAVPAAPAGYQGRAHPRPLLVPVVGVLALVAIAELVLHVSIGHHGAGFWWAIPVGALVLRKLVLRTGGPRGFRRF